MGQINVAIIGVGNCASSLVQGIHKYSEVQDNELQVPGLMHNVLGGYSIGDVNVVAAFDVDKDNKVIKRLKLNNHLKLLESLWNNNSLNNLKLLDKQILFILVSFDLNLNDFEHDKINIVVKKLTGDHDIHAQKPEIVSKIINDWIKGKIIGIT